MDAVKTGALIAQKRKEQDLTQSDLAQSLHVSVQAVSKWERGLNFPDITLLEPLALLLGLTVSELMSGGMDSRPHEELVRESVRLGTEQLGGRIKKWRRRFWAAAAALLTVLAAAAFFYIRANTTLIPQRHTVIEPVTINEMDSLVARVAGGHVLSAFDLTLADGLEEYAFQLEQWEESGLVWSSKILAARTAGEPYPRHEDLAFAFSLAGGDLSWTLSCGGCITSSALESLPCLSPRSDGTHPGYGWHFLEEKTTLDPATGTVLAAIGIDGGSGIRTLVDGNCAQPLLTQGQTVFLLRLSVK